VQANGFGERAPCTYDDQTHPLAELDIAPWSASAYALHSWIEQRHNSSMLLEASMTCLSNNLPSECSDLQNVGQVFVLLRASEYKAPMQDTVQMCNASICANTAEKTQPLRKGVRSFVIRKSKSGNVSQSLMWTSRT
jgi:hypothetical protein